MSEQSALDAGPSFVFGGEDWMGAPAYEANDERWVALESYLQEQAGQAEAPPVDLQIVDAPTDLTGGDEMAGQAPGGSGQGLGKRFRGRG